MAITRIKRICQMIDEWRARNGFNSMKVSYRKYKEMGFTDEEISLFFLYENYEFYETSTV